MPTGGDGIKRNLEKEGLYINRWMTGEVTNRSTLYTPISAMGLQMIARQDAFTDGLNMELSPQLTPVRAYGFSRYCSTAFGGSDYPLTGFSFKNLSGTIKLLVDTPTKLINFTTSAQTTVFAKSGTAQGSIAKDGNLSYYCNGTDADQKKWDQTTATKIGIVAPVVAPTLSFGAGALSPVSGYSYGYCHHNSSSGHLSTMSPASANTGSLTAQNITVSYTASGDAQVDKIWLFRIVDGGSQYYFLAEVANASSTYTDSTPDAGLNTDIVAPLAHQNDPPPSGISLFVWHAGRMWAATANKLYYSAGPDLGTDQGVGSEAWPPANVKLCNGKITALASTSNGLVVWTSDDMFVVLGDDAASFTVPQLAQKNFGVPNQNHVAQDGDLIFIYTSNSQCFSIGSDLEEVGNVVADKLRADFPAGSCYLALHRSGEDQGLWISNGSTKIRRYNLALNAWDVERQVVGGAGAIFSVEASASNYKLFTGRTAGSGYLLARDITTYQDDGTSFACSSVVGSLVVSPPGSVAITNSILMQVKQTGGSYPTISILPNEISGTFTTLPNPVNDPPMLPPSKSLWQKRHYLKSAAAPVPQHMCHLQVQFAFPAENYRAEVLGLGID